MILNLLIAFHVAVSLVGIGSGVLVVYDFLSSGPYTSRAPVFLISTALTSLSGFLFPATRFMPSHAVGLISLGVLAIAAATRPASRLTGGWPKAYISSALAALYLNMFVFVIQLFRRVAALQRLAPTQSEPAFQVVQLALLAAFAAIAFAALAKVRSPSVTGERYSGN